MSTNLIQRLRTYVETDDYMSAEGLCQEAADRLAAVEAERDQLRAEVEALRADAERYRWLRTSEVDSYLASGSGEKLDAEIDKARKG